MKPNFQIRIPKRSSTCSVCKEELTHGTVFHSLVLEGEEEWERKDYHEACWNTESQPQLPEGTMSWSAKIPDVPTEEATPHMTRDERGFLRLQECLEQEDEELQAEAYLLAQYLSRRKQLVLRKHIRRKNGLFLLFEALEGKDTFVVRQPTLSAASLITVEQRLIADLLGKPIEVEEKEEAVVVETNDVQP